MALDPSQQPNWQGTVAGFAAGVVAWAEAFASALGVGSVSEYPKDKPPYAAFGPAILDASAPVSWAEQPGTAPWMGTITLDKREAAKIDLAREATMTIAGGGWRLDVKQLYAIAYQAAPDPYRATLVLADQRIWWKRQWVFRKFNIRTRTGSRYRMDIDGGATQETAPTVDDVGFKKFSLKGGTDVYEARDILATVLDIVVGSGKWVGDLGQFDQRYVTDVEIDDRGDVAIDKALGYLNGAGIKVRADGIVEVYNRYDLDAVTYCLENLAKPTIVGSPVPAHEDLTNVRPGSIGVLFGIEQEMRWDAENLDDGTEAYDPDEPMMRNVMPCPDPTLSITDQETGEQRTVVQGTWITYPEAFEAWNADLPSEAPPLTDEVIRKWWMKSMLERVYAKMGTVDPNVIWARRVAALRNNYRLTWRCSRRWMQAIYSLKPYRCAILDPETGQFAETSVYTDWAIQFNERGLIAQQNSAAEVGALHLNFQGGAQRNHALSTGEAAPAVVRVLDEQQGIVQIEFKRDLLQHVHEYVPGWFEGVATYDSKTWNAKGWYFTDGTQWKGRRVAAGAGAGCFLMNFHRLSVVMTVAPGSPNNIGNLWAEDVPFEEAKPYLPGTYRGAFALGPRWWIRISPQIATARFAWQHDRREAIKQSFGIREGDPANRYELDDLLQNPRELKDLARAMAAGIYGAMPDHYVGARVCAFAPQVHVVGNIGRIVHSLSTNGEIRTTVVLAEDPAPIDGMALLGPGARRIFLREVQQ